MTLWEMAWLMGEPFMPVLYGKVRRDVGHLVERAPCRPASLLDVGGRTSPYTSGLAAEITLLDLPRETEVQKRLNLGLTDDRISRLKRRRSNIRNIVLEDMTRSSLPSESFDGVVCVEVIEHVQDDAAFLDQIRRVLKPGGWVYLTTPNGDYIPNAPPNYNPDHVRHYTRQGLADLLTGYYSEVSVTYGVKTGKYRFHGLRSPDPRHPARLLRSMVCNSINWLESRGLENQPRRTAHLFAIARK